MKSTSCSDTTQVIEWKLDSLEYIGGHEVELLGNPVVVETEVGIAVRFDGIDDGLILNTNPLHEFGTFTVEVLFKPESDGLAEQRFLHFQDDAGNRGLIETRLYGNKTWSLDTFLLNVSPESRLTLLDSDNTHALDKWYWVAMSYDGEILRHYVNGNEEMSGNVNFTPMGSGKVSIGVRLNRIHWFKGQIAVIRIHPHAIEKKDLKAYVSER